MKSIHEQLYSKRLAAGLSQQELARRANLRQATISAIEAGGDVKLSSMERLAAALGLSLMLGEDRALRRAKAPARKVFLRAVAHGALSNTAGMMFPERFFDGVQVDTARDVL